MNQTNPMMIFSGTSNAPLASDIMLKLFNGKGGSFVGTTDIKKFPDGEIHVKLCDNVRGRDVFMIQSPARTVNDSLMELYIMIDAAKRSSADRITAVMPFFPYARQDRKDQPRVSITAKLVANLLVAAGVDRVLTMDLHAPQIQGFFDIPVDHLQALPLFVNYIRENNKKDLTNIVAVAPDVGRSKVAVQYGKALKCPFAIISKDRIDATTVQSDILIGEVKDKIALIIDDLSTTAGTLVAAANLCKSHGAKKIIVGFTHNLLTEKGYEKLYENPDCVSCIDEILFTDTVHQYWASDTRTKVISVADMFAKAILAINGNESISSLFEV